MRRALDDTDNDTGSEDVKNPADAEPRVAK